MSVERTISIIKPDADAKNVIGEIYNRFEKAGLKVVASFIDENAVHGSDGSDTAKVETALFFSDAEICPRTR